MCVCHNRTSEKIYPVVERVIGSAECNSDIGQGYLFLPHSLISLALILNVLWLLLSSSPIPIVYIWPPSLFPSSLSLSPLSPIPVHSFLTPSVSLVPTFSLPPLFPLPPYFLTPSPAISYECIKTVATIYPNNSVVSTTAKCLSRFVTSTNNDWRYLGINGLASLVQVMYLHKKCCHFIQCNFIVYIVMLLDNVLNYVRAENSCRSR